jgi:hypothetical protein
VRATLERRHTGNQKGEQEPEGRSQDSAGKRTIKGPYFEDQENSRKMPGNYNLPKDARVRILLEKGPSRDHILKIRKIPEKC